MATHVLEICDLLSGKLDSLKLKTGEQHRIVVKYKDIHFVEFSDTLFRTNSAVPLPIVDEHPGEEPVLFALEAAATALLFAEAHPDHVCVVAGHTDTVGGPADNVRLSRLRAEAVHGLVAGKREQFANACWGPHLSDDQRYPNGGDGSKAGVLWSDYADILNWIADEQGWSCRTGYPKRAPWLYDATVAFQKAYNASSVGQAQSSPLKLTGRFDKPTWAAVYDCLEMGLAKALEIDLADLSDLRDNVTAPEAGPERVACGESRPVDAADRDEYDSPTNRRAEVLFFEPRHAPKVPCQQGDCTPKECELCGTEWWRRHRIGEPDLREDFHEMTLWLLDHTGQRMGADPASSDPVAQVKGAPYHLCLPSGEVRTGYADQDGRVTEYDFPDNVECVLKWGKRPDTAWASHPDDPDELDDFFEYEETIFIGDDPPSMELAAQQLSNLGYTGTATHCRQCFSTHYGDSDDSSICAVHDTGRPRGTT